MAKKSNDKETPEWVNRDDSPMQFMSINSNSLKSGQEQHAPKVQHSRNLSKFVILHLYVSFKERIIPIQLERTPPVTTMSSPNFDPYVGTPSPGPKNGSNGRNV